MSEILPAILVPDALKFKEKIDILEGHADAVQIDIMDGAFVPHTTFADPAAILAFHSSLQHELHLMVNDPAPYLRAWSVVPSVIRAIIHAEIDRPLAPLLETIKENGWEAGIALNPETPWEAIDEFISQLDTVLVMTVHPGKSGQPFAEAVVEHHLLAKIADLHQAHPGLVIGVDGGVNAETLPLLLEAGATRFIVGSGIWNTPDPAATLSQLQKIVAEHRT
ncbi:MAG: ribulose-phosphate 3-epimerase [bacterium]|nr:ribulose-phosphate 3-epimerase [bacterium]